MLAVVGLSFNTEDSQDILRTSWFATMAHQLMCGNSLSTILPMILAIVHVSDVTPQLVYVHQTANLLSGQIGPPGKYILFFIY